MNNTTPHGYHGQDVYLKIFFGSNMIAAWADGPDNFSSGYRTAALTHANNGSTKFTTEYLNQTSGTVVNKVKFELWTFVCVGSEPLEKEIHKSWESKSFSVPTADPVLNLNTTSLDFEAATETWNDALTITNTGGGTLNWDAQPSKNWITLSNEQGTSPYNMNVTVTRGDIPRQERNVKKHTGAIAFSGNGGTPSVTVSADLTAPPAPQNLTLSHSGTFSNPQLAWSESALYYRYHIERNTAGTGWMEIATTTGTAYTDTDAFVDTQSGDDIQYRVRAWNGAGFSTDYSNTASVDGYAPYKIDTTDEHFALTVSEILPDEYALGHCYPNPGNPGTSVRFQLPEEGQVDIRIYNIRGETVRTLFSGQKQAGFHRIDWDGRTNAGAIAGTGLYIIVLHAGGRTFNTKYTLIK